MTKSYILHNRKHRHGMGRDAFECIGPLRFTSSDVLGPKSPLGRAVKRRRYVCMMTGQNYVETEEMRPAVEQGVA